MTGLRRAWILAACALAAASLATGASAQTDPVSRFGLEYRPLPPCRVFNVRLVERQTRALRITGAGLEGQSGPAGGCGVPAHATRIALALTTFNPASQGHLILHPPGSARPGTSSLYYAPGAPVSFRADAELADGSTLLYSRYPVQVFGDVVGYYAPPIAAAVDRWGNVYVKTSRVISVKPAYGGYQVDIAGNGSGCIVQATPSYPGPIMAVQSYVSYFLIFTINPQTLKLEPADFTFHALCPDVAG